MKLTKYKHACFTLEKNGQLLVVDPGDWSSDLPILKGVAAIVITHGHADHYSPSVLETILQNNPAAVVVGHQTVVEKLSHLPTQAISAGEVAHIGAFELRFFGGDHAVIHSSLAAVPNLGVLINHSLYYPGDSFVRPDCSVATLALPVTAPWLKISEVIDFAQSLQAPFVFPTHDAIATDIGKSLVDRLVGGSVEQYGGNYQRLVAPVDIDG